MKNIKISYSQMANSIKNRRPRGYWTFDRIKQIALKCLSVIEFKKNYLDAYHAAHRKNIFLTVCSHMIDIKRRKLTREDIKSEALNYKTRIEFKNNDESAYNAALRMNDPEFFFYHMEHSKGEAYTFEELRQISLPYKTRGEFKIKNPTAHRAACKREDYDQICAHMDLIGGVSEGEIELLCTLKSFCPNATKLVDRKVKIKDKPYIKGFDIDILIEKHGIEFDGTWTHSFEGLKRNRKHWSDEDIQNYHQIKDNWFATKGIKILHIKEEDWKKDKQFCINKCLEFLGVKCQ